MLGIGFLCHKFYHGLIHDVKENGRFAFPTEFVRGAYFGRAVVAQAGTCGFFILRLHV